MIYVNEKCWKCGKSLNGWMPDYRAIGVPVVKCDSCNAINDRSKRATEWVLLGEEQKLGQILLALYWAFAWSIGVSVVVGMLAMEIFPTLKNVSFLSQETFMIWAASFAISAVWQFWRLNVEIKKSNKRLQQPEYVEALSKLGLIKTDR